MNGTYAGFLVLIIGFLLLGVIDTLLFMPKLSRYKQITLGMPEQEMLKIMGKGYDKSLLKNNKNKYEWRINATSYGYRGFRTYSGVRKVDIVTQNGVVIEVRPYNVG